MDKYRAQIQRTRKGIYIYTKWLVQIVAPAVVVLQQMAAQVAVVMEVAQPEDVIK